MRDDQDFRVRARVIRIEGNDRQVIRTFSSKQRALRFANELIKQERSAYRGTSSVRYEVEVQIPEIHLKLSDRTKRLVPLSHKMVKQLIAALIEATHDISRTYYEKTINGRKLDVVLENVVEEKPFQVFVEVESRPVGEQYIQDFLRFCEEKNPSKAMIVSPVLRRETRFWIDSTRNKKRSLEIIPTKDLFKELQNNYSLKFDIIGGDVVLVLDPFKEIIIKHPDALDGFPKQNQSNEQKRQRE